MIKPIGVGAIIFLIHLSAEAASFTGLGDLPGGLFQSEAWDLSDDGTVVVGTSMSGGDQSTGYIRQAFRWTQATGMVGLGFLPGYTTNSRAFAVSGDGAIIVGRSESASGVQAFRWTQGAGLVGLLDLAGGSAKSGAYAISSDGTVIAGEGTNTSGTQAVRWSNGGPITLIGDLAGGTVESRMFGANSDGTVLVGLGYDATGQQATRWTQSGGLIGLGDLPGAVFRSSANATSANGSVVVGFATSASGTEAFRWTQASGMVGLGDLPGGSFSSYASDVTADGSVIVGYSTGTIATNEAFIWTSSGGMQTLLNVLLANGATGLAGWQLNGIESISADGKWVVGLGRNPAGQSEAFLANITPIPIPAAAWLLGSALAGLTALRRHAAVA